MLSANFLTLEINITNQLFDHYGKNYEEIVLKLEYRFFKSIIKLFRKYLVNTYLLLVLGQSSIYIWIGRTTNSQQDSLISKNSSRLKLIQLQERFRNHKESFLSTSRQDGSFNCVQERPAARSSAPC